MSLRFVVPRLSSALAAGLILAACGGSAAPTSAPAAPPTSPPAKPTAPLTQPAPASASPAASPAAASQPVAASVPNLKGKTIKFTLGAGAPHVSDSETYIVVQMLKQWGADATLQLGAGTTPTMAVVSGQEDVVSQGMSDMLNAGLSIFGPNQPHVDYVMVSKNLTSVDELPGHTFGVAAKNGVDVMLLQAVLAQHNIPFDKVPRLEIGTVSNAVNAMIGGKLDAAFIHADTVKTAQDQGGLHVLATASKDVSWSADSFVAAKPEWLTAHPDLAIAVNEAYLAAAKIFNTDTPQWVKYAQEYTQHATSDASVTAAHDLFKSSNLWPDDASAYSIDILQKNWDGANAMGDIKERGQRPVAQWSDQTAWQAAVKAMLH